MKTITLILGLIFFSLNSQAQKVITVDNRANSGADYTSFSDAVDNAIVGDTIYVHPSATSYGSKNIIKRLIIVAISHNPNNTPEAAEAKLSNINFGGTSNNSLITGFQISNISTTTITDINDIRIINNRFIGNVTGNPSANAQNWLVEGNIFNTGQVNVNNATGMMIKNNIFDNNSYALSNANNTTSFLNNLVINSSANFAYQCTDPIVNNNIFLLENSITSVGLNSSTISFNNNLTYNTITLDVDDLSGSNNIDSENPGFVNAPFISIDDYYNNDYNITNANAQNGGTDGTDLGIFGANFNFDVQGRPNDFPYMTSLNISNSSVAMGQNINVTFIAEKKN